MISDDTCKLCNSGVVVQPHPSDQKHAILRCERDCGARSVVISTGKITSAHPAHEHYNITDAGAYDKYEFK